MSTTRLNAVDPSIDVKGTTTVQNTRTLPTDERYFMGLSASNGPIGAADITAPVGGYQTLTDAGASFTDADIGRFVEILNSTAGNDGTFLITARTATSITYIGAPGGGVENPFNAGTWNVHEPYTIADDINFGRTDRKNIKGTAAHYTNVPTYVRPDATGTPRPADLTNIAGMTNDAKPIVRDVLQHNVAFRPPISVVGSSGVGAGIDAFTGVQPNMTLTIALATWTADDVGRFITITGSTTGGNDGTFVITSIGGGGTAASYQNGTGFAEGFLGNWKVGDTNLAIGDETFVTSGLHFVAGDLNSFITISNSTDANGTYRIKTVTDGKTLELDGLNSATAETCDWALVAGLKGVLCTGINYATATNTCGIPIADAGAYDQTRYDATYVEMIDPTVGASTVTNAGLAIWGRSFGDTKDPNGTVTNDLVRFFVQLYTGVNDGTATVAALQMLSGRSGAAATLAGGTKTITGLSGMLTDDVGRWITIWDCGTAGNCGIYQIATVNSATSVTVTRGSFFTGPDTSNGSIRWAVSNEGALWDFYNGQRFRFDLLDETAFRTTMIGGIVSDAALSTAIHNLQIYTGENPGVTNPVLTKTGNYYVFSNLTNPATSNLTEIVQAINDQIGDRTYTGGILGAFDGETITASLQRLSVAITAASVVRTIERLASGGPGVPKFTNHPVPVTYILDGTGNGRNLWVFWRGLLRDPGTVANGDDYQETDTTHITNYTKINAGDHINYFVVG